MVKVKQSVHPETNWEKVDMTYLKSLFGLAVAAFVAVSFMAQASA